MRVDGVYAPHSATVRSDFAFPTYTWISEVPKYSAEQLREAVPISDETYLGVPSNLPPRIIELARRITADHSLTGGQQHDITQAEELIAGYAGEHVLADQGYDAQEFRQHILDLGMMPVIPPRSNRKEPADYDRHLYRERHLVECFINKIKHYRRIFSRFEKLDTRYLGFLHFTAALIWLR